MNEDEEPAKSNLIQQPRSDLAKRSDYLVKRGLHLLASSEQRTVFFPSGSSLGWVSAADNRNLVSDDDRPSIDLGEARGKKVIPAGWDLELYLDTDGPADLSSLLVLKPNVLQNLVVHPRCVVMDSDLTYIGQLTGLLRLSLNCQFEISDAGLNHIRNLTSLRYLDLTMAAGVTGDGLKMLSNMPQLEHLILLGTKLDDNAVGPLGILTSLKYLNLEYTHISQQGVDILKGLIEDSSIAYSHRPKRENEGSIGRVERPESSRSASSQKSLSEKVRELGGIRPSDQ